ncbi:putative HMG box protein [Monocercomonoides exilis]|uniref:putative HMG box protein n=1 Tax=Monocercomonoides exilis TaxID=2049356 RepID=UPI003559B4D4|nr:putative HMG box protein [Monocercomonoides exilis]
MSSIKLDAKSKEDEIRESIYDDDDDDDEPMLISETDIVQPEPISEEEFQEKILHGGDFYLNQTCDSPALLDLHDFEDESDKKNEKECTNFTHSEHSSQKENEDISDVIFETEKMDFEPKEAFIKNISQPSVSEKRRFRDKEKEIFESVEEESEDDSDSYEFFLKNNPDIFTDEDSESENESGDSSLEELYPKKTPQREQPAIRNIIPNSKCISQKRFAPPLTLQNDAASDVMLSSFLLKPTSSGDLFLSNVLTPPPPRFHLPQILSQHKNENSSPLKTIESKISTLSDEFPIFVTPSIKSKDRTNPFSSTPSSLLEPSSSSLPSATHSSFISSTPMNKIMESQSGKPSQSFIISSTKKSTPLRKPKHIPTPLTPAAFAMLSKLPSSPRMYSEYQFARHRNELAAAVFAFINKRVFDDRLPSETKIEWSKTLRTTAGTAFTTWKKIKKISEKKSECESSCAASTENSMQSLEEVIEIPESARIALSTKVITNFDSLVSTMAHEMCHLAKSFIDKEHDTRHHGQTFRKWGRRTKSRIGVEVSTYHHYEIQYKYQWKCEICGQMYRRHSKSIDVEKVRCGVCSGKLVFIPTQKKEKAKSSTHMENDENSKNQTENEENVRNQKLNPFMEFVKRNREDFKTKHPGLSGKEMMKELGILYRQSKNSIVSESI